MKKSHSIVMGEYLYKLTDYRVQRYDFNTNEYIDSGLDFKHGEYEFELLLRLLWQNYTKDIEFKDTESEDEHSN